MRASARGMRRSWVFATGLVLLALTVVTSCESEVTEHYRVSGFVRDLTTERGIGGVSVTFTSDTLRTARTTTAGNGAYEMNVRSDVPFGQVRAEREGFTVDQRTVHFDSKDRRLDLGLRELTP